MEPSENDESRYKMIEKCYNDNDYETFHILIDRNNNDFLYNWKTNSETY